MKSDRDIVLEMSSKGLYVMMSAYDLGTIFEFGERAKIINSLNYMTVINRLREALNTLWLDGKCNKMKTGKGYTYFFKHN